MRPKDISNDRDDPVDDVLLVPGKKHAIELKVLKDVAGMTRAETAVYMAKRLVGAIRKGKPAPP